jgi:hypothetical protein
VYKYTFVCHTLPVNAKSVERTRWSPVSVCQAPAVARIEGEKELGGIYIMRSNGSIGSPAERSTLIAQRSPGQRRRAVSLMNSSIS